MHVTKCAQLTKTTSSQNALMLQNNCRHVFESVSGIISAVQVAKFLQNVNKFGRFSLSLHPIFVWPTIRISSRRVEEGEE